MPEQPDWKTIEANYYMQVVRRMPIVLVRGQGTSVWDDEGKEYLDFTAGWAVLNLGHSHPEVTAAVQNQASQLVQMTNLFYTVPQLKLAQILIDNSCMNRVFFCNSGAEANEGVSKLARKWGLKELGGAYEIITATNSFHGRTLGMMAATGQGHYQLAWQPLTPGFVNVEYNNFEAIRAATNEKTCAVLLEPVQGEGGVNVPDRQYLADVRQWCDQKGILMMMDEVQTGMGRIGSLFGYKRFDVEPDVMALGKALGGGAPLGAFLCKEPFSVLEPGDHGSTFGGNALTTASGWAAAKYMVEHDIPATAMKTGAKLQDSLNSLRDKHDCITDVRGMGLLIGFEMADDRAPAVVQECAKNGLLINAVRPNTVRFMPPLTVSGDEIDSAISIFDSALSKSEASAH